MIMVGPAVPDLVGGGSRLAVVVTVAKGYDLGYIWKTRSEAAGRAAGGWNMPVRAAASPNAAIP